MNVKIVLFILSTIVFYQCGNKSKQQAKDVTVEDLSSEVDTIREIQLSGTHSYKYHLKFSDIVEDVQYIPLETNPDCFLGDRHSLLLLTDNFIFIAFNGVVLQFDRQGQFLRKINTPGQGPFECYERNVAFDEKRKLIYILDNGKLDVYVFDYTGKPVKIIKNPFKGQVEHISEMLLTGIMCDEEGNLFWYFEYDFGNMKYKYAVTNHQGEIIAVNDNYDLYKNDRKIYVFSMYPNPFHIYDRRLYYQRPYNDTVFSINDDYSVSPSVIIHLPKRITMEENIKTGTKELDFASLSSRMLFYETREDKRYLYIYYKYGPFSGENVKLLSRYDKKSKELMESINPKIINDWDGGINVELDPYCQKENIFIYTEFPFKIKEMLSKEQMKQRDVIHPEKRISRIVRQGKGR